MNVRCRNADRMDLDDARETILTQFEALTCAHGAKGYVFAYFDLEADAQRMRFLVDRASQMDWLQRIEEQVGKR